MEIKTPMERKIVTEAIDQGVDPVMALKIARCESGFDQGIKNTHSSASGIFQIIRGTWLSTLKLMGLPLNLDVFDGSMNIKVAIFLMKQEGLTPWIASEHCWG